MTPKHYIVLVSESEVKLVTNLPEKPEYLMNNPELATYNLKMLRWSEQVQQAIKSSPFIKNFEIAEELMIKQCFGIISRPSPLRTQLFKERVEIGKPYLVDLSGQIIGEVLCYNCGWLEKDHRQKHCYDHSDESEDYFRAHEFFKPSVSISPKQDSAHTEGIKPKIMNIVVYKDGSYIKIEAPTFEYEGDPDWLVTIELEPALRNPLPTEGQTKELLNDFLTCFHDDGVSSKQEIIDRFLGSYTKVSEGQSETQLDLLTEIESNIRYALDEANGHAGGTDYVMIEIRKFTITRKKP